MAPTKKQAGKRKDQAPPEPEPSKRPKGPTASVRRERERVVQEVGGPPRQQRKEARKQAKAQAQAEASHFEADAAGDAAAHVVDLPEGAPGAVPEVQAASSPDHGSADSEGQELSEHEFADEEEEDVVLLREPTVPKRKKKNVKGPLWSDCRFEDVVPVEFPGGPKDKDVLSSYGSHIARYVYEGFDRVELTPNSHGRKLRVFNQKLPNEAWFVDRIAKTGLADLAKTGHMMVDSFLISAFAERWHEETSSFHVSAGEVTVTLGDVSCLLHLSNVGRLSDHQYVNKEEGTKLMVDLCGADPADIENEMVKTKGSHVMYTYLQTHFQTLRAHIDAYEVEGNQDEVLRHQNFALRTYLLLMVGYTIFADTSKNCVYIHHVKNFDGLETVSEIAWGPAALVCLYKGLTACTAPSVSTLAGYMTLLQAWIHHHFPTLCEHLEDERYDETMPAANRYSPRGGDQSVPARRVSLDRLLRCDIHWTLYDTHRATRPFDEVCFYSGWLRCGGKMVMYLHERVLRQFGHVQSIPRHPRESAPPFLTASATALITVSLHFAGFMERVLTVAQRGPFVIDPWYAVSGYMRWYFRISHPYMTPLRGDPPRPLWRSRLSWLDPWRHVLRAN